MSVPALPTERPALLSRLDPARQWDVAIIGGGASGLGVAVDAALRGYSVVLLEARDFAGGTSSRATKLVHGGVRYLAQGNVHLVREALHERAHILHSAPHLASPLAFVMPSYHLWETPFYGAGLKLYDLLAGRQGLGPTRWLGRKQVLDLLPGAQAHGLKGGVKYWDAQFDDARLALALARTAAQHDALLINYCRVSEILHEGGKVSGLVATDGETGRDYRVQARCVINATGVWADGIRTLDAKAAGRTPQHMVKPSQGAHLVVDQDFLPGKHALLVPSTHDGRVLFAVPWLGKLILGTTDVAQDQAAIDPQPSAEEIDFILREIRPYLCRAPQRADVRSAWAGLRPLVQAEVEADAQATKRISREHVVRMARSGLVTVAGGKWTTYRAMAEDVLDRCIDHGVLAYRKPCQTAFVRLAGAPEQEQQAPEGELADAPGLHAYGSDVAQLMAFPGADRWLAPGLSEAMVRFAVQHEWARTVQDVLARRSRLLFLDARAAAQAAPAVAALLAQLPVADPQLAAFEQQAARYALEHSPADV